MRPKAEEVMFRLPGISRFSMLNRLKIATSNRARVGPPVLNALPIVIESSFVPGPINLPTGAFPKRPMLVAGRMKQLASNHRSTVGESRLPSQEPWSGRWEDVKPRLSVPVPEGSLALLKNGVRKGPDCTSRLPEMSHPPASAFIA